MTAGPSSTGSRWVNWSPSGVPGAATEASLGWVLAAKQRLYGLGRWSWVDIAVYETLFTLVDIRLPEGGDPVLAWTGTYEELAAAIGGGSPRPSRSGDRLLSRKALAASRDRLSGRGLVTADKLNVATKRPDGSVKVTSEGLLWRLQVQHEAVYDLVLTHLGPDAADQWASEGSTVLARLQDAGVTLPVSLDPRLRPVASSGSHRGHSPMASPGNDRPLPSPGPIAPSGGDRAAVAMAPSGGNGRSLQQAAMAASGRDRSDLHERASEAVPERWPREAASTPPPDSTLTTPQEDSWDPQGTAEQVHQALAQLEVTPQQAVEQACTALLEHGWRGGSPQRWVRKLGWRAVAVAPLVEHFAADLANPGATVGFVRKALPVDGVPSEERWSDEQLLELVLGRGSFHVEPELTDHEAQQRKSLLDWALTRDEVTRDATVEAYGGRLLRLATEAGIGPATFLNDRARLREVLARPEPLDPEPLDPDAQGAPAPRPAAEQPGPVVAAASGMAGEGADGAPDAALGQKWLDQASMLATDAALVGPQVAASWAEVAARGASEDRDQRLRLVALAAVHALEGDLELATKLADVARGGSGIQVRSWVGRDQRWQLD